jgi:uncharacterized protein YecT (DUF1311 family)
MHSFVFSARLVCVGVVFLIATGVPSAAQDRNIKRCLSITDVNERVDCLESGGTVPQEITPPSSAPPKPIRMAPSFDCRAASNSIERAICGNPTLSAWDSRMGQQYQQALRIKKDGDAQSILASQRAWIQERNSRCGSVTDIAVWDCLLGMTKQRIDSLTKLLATDTEVTMPLPAPVQVAPPNLTSPPMIAPPSTNTPAPSAVAPTVVVPKSPAPIPVIPRTASPSTPAEESSNPLLIGLFVIGALIGAIKIVGNVNRKERRRRLVAMYGEEDADRIIARQIWQDMTEDQLIESWGAPVDKDTEIRRNKTKETWKYGQTGKNRFNNRVFVENGIVTGWKG